MARTSEFLDFRAAGVAQIHAQAVLAGVTGLPRHATKERRAADIHVEAPAVEYKELSSEERAESSEAIRERVLRARKCQLERFAGKPKCRANAQMSQGLLRT